VRIYHGGYCFIDEPKILASQNSRDFGRGFYCTQIEVQAQRWAKRYGTATVSVYEYSQLQGLDILHFPTMTQEWLDFIVKCRKGDCHNHDIVEGAMANDQVWNYIGDYVSGVLTRQQFWALAEFKYPTHQISFCSQKSLACLKFIESYEVKK
jgi:hypothetical protein